MREQGKQYDIVMGNIDEWKHQQYQQFYSNVSSIPIFADKLVTCDKCNISIGLRIRGGNSDSISDASALEIFRENGWLLDSKRWIKLCPKCKDRVK